MKRVTTANLTKWSNLYSTELKCELRVNSSLLILELFLGLLLISSITFSFLYVELALLSWQFSIIALLIGCIVLHIVKKYLQAKLSKDTLLINGFTHQVNINGQHYQLDWRSRVAFYGCYLVITKSEKHCAAGEEENGWKLVNRKLKAMFERKCYLIDKRQLSSEQYSSLVYIIKKVQQS